MQSSQCGWRQRPDRRRDDVRRERYCGPNDVLRRITCLKGNLPNKAKSHFFVTAVAQIIRTDGCDLGQFLFQRYYLIGRLTE
jgi:hypothetical protein